MVQEKPALSPTGIYRVKSEQRAERGKGDLGYGAEVGETAVSRFGLGGLL